MQEKRRGWLRSFPVDGKRYWADLFVQNGKMGSHGLLERDLETGKELRRLDFRSRPYLLAQSVDGKQLTAAQPSKIAGVCVHLCDLEVDRERLYLEGHTDEINRVEFTPDGRYLVTTAEDKTARIWDTRSGKCLKIVEQPADKTHRSVQHLAISLDGRYFATITDGDTVVRLWSLPDGEAMSTLEPTADPSENARQFSGVGRKGQARARRRRPHRLCRLTTTWRTAKRSSRGHADFRGLPFSRGPIAGIISCVWGESPFTHSRAVAQLG